MISLFKFRRLTRLSITAARKWSISLSRRMFLENTPAIRVHNQRLELHQLVQLVKSNTISSIIVKNKLILVSTIILRIMLVNYSSFLWLNKFSVLHLRLFIIPILNSVLSNRSLNSSKIDRHITRECKLHPLCRNRLQRAKWNNLVYLEF